MANKVTSSERRQRYVKRAARQKEEVQQVDECDVDEQLERLLKGDASPTQLSGEMLEHAQRQHADAKRVVSDTQHEYDALVRMGADTRTSMSLLESYDFQMNLRQAMARLRQAKHRLDEADLQWTHTNSIDALMRRSIDALLELRQSQ